MHRHHLPGDSAYNDAHAAEDLEALRAQWDVPALALLGVGSGARVALAYAGSHPNKVARLLLDSPVAADIAAEAAAEQRLKGQQSAFDAFAAQCVANNCPLGPDPAGAVGDLLTRAQNGGLPWSRATVVRAITTALAYPVGDSTAVVQNLANTLNAARGPTAARWPRWWTGPTRCAIPTGSSSTPAATRWPVPPRTECGNWSSPGASSTRCSAARLPWNW